MSPEPRRQPPALDGIVRALDTARGRAPSAGPGWSLCFKDGTGRVLLSCTLGSYAQVECLAEEVAPLGYALVILDGDVDCDFMFVHSAEGGQDILVAPDAHRDAGIGKLPPSAAAAARPVLRGCLAMQDTGGPVMYVSAVSGELAYCVWFSDRAELSSGTFHTRRLVNVDTVQRNAPVATVPDALPVRY